MSHLGASTAKILTERLQKPHIIVANSSFDIWKLAENGIRGLENPAARIYDKLELWKGVWSGRAGV